MGIKISDLPVATTPLTGAELVPVVQGGVTDKTTVAALQVPVYNALAASSGSGLVGFLQSGTGAAARTIQAKARDMVSVKDFGAVGNGVADDTAAFNAAKAASLSVYVPEGTYRLTTFVIDRDGFSLVTSGYGTVFQQASGQVGDIRLIVVAASNVTIGPAFTVRGNIATDTGEQRHGVFVYKAGGSIQNITVGDVRGEDLRGDVLYIGAPNGFTTRYVTFGRIVGKNVLRNVVSIVGGSYINGDAAITDTSTGLWTLDIEPDTVTSTDIYVGYVRGGFMGCVPPNVANTARRIHIGRVELNPAFGVDSTPGYSGRLASNAVTLRNTVDLTIDHLDINGHSGLGLQYIFNSGEQRGEAIRIGYLRAQNIGAGEATVNAVINAVAISSLTIDSADVALQAVGDALVECDTSGVTFTRLIINALRIDGRVVGFARHGRFSNIVINTVNATTAFVQCNDCTILDSDITISTLISFSSRCVFVNVKAVCSTAYYGSTTADMTRINCDWGGVVTPFATQRAVAAALTGEVAYGSGTATTVGAAGAAAALPANPTGYLVINVAGTDRKVPFYAN